jgi:hypothetical protein
VGPGGLTSLLVAMSFGGHVGQPLPIAAHHPIGQFVPYQLMQGNWHELAKKGRQNRLVMAILLCHGESGSGVLFHGCVLAIV